MVVKKKTEADPDFSTDEILVTESTFNSRLQIPELLDFLKREKASGTLCFDMANGGVSRIRFTQKQKVDVII
jgi:hypothetical protein